MNDMGKIAIGIFPEGRPPKKQQVVKPKDRIHGYNFGLSE